MKKKILNIFIVLGYLWLSLAFIYTSVLPAEFKAKLPHVDIWSFAMSGVVTGGVSTILMYVKHYISKERVSNLETMIELHKKISENDDRTKEQVDKLKSLIYEQSANIKKFIEQTANKEVIEKENAERLERIIELIEVELKSKMSNPFVEKDVLSEIEEVLGVEKEE